MMNFSAFGALSQVFVVEAIRFYSEQVLKQSEPADSSEGIINPRIWWKLAEDMQKQIYDNYEFSDNHESYDKS